MKRAIKNGLFAITAAAAAFTTTACDGDSGPDVDPDTEWELHVTVEGDGAGRIQVAGTGLSTTCTNGCAYDVLANDVVTLVAVADEGSTFVDWSGDCSGTEETVTQTSAAGGMVDCIATFTAPAAIDPPREGVLVGNRQTCLPNQSGPAGFNCNVAPGGSFNINAPSPTLDAALLTANDFCYYYVDVTDFSSEDHGVVGLVTSQINATGTWSGGYYSFTGLTAAPFNTSDSLAITTTGGGTVNITAPPTITMVDDATDGYLVTTSGTADSVRLAAFGYDADDNSFGVLCRFPFEAEAPVSNPDFVAALQLAGGGATPDIVFAGISNQADLVGWDDEPRVGEAVRWVQMAGGILEQMGELQPL